MTNVVIHWKPLHEARQRAETKPNKDQLDEKLISVDEVIAELVRSDPSVVLWDDPHAPGVAGLFKSGDRVTLYGCLRRFCLEGAYEALEAKGVCVEYSPNGCF